MPSQRDLFESRYRQIAATERIGWSDDDTIADSIERIHRAIRNCTPVSLLELGCGRGNIALAFADEWQVTSIDFSPTAIRWANQLAEQQKKTATFIEGDLTNPWPFTDDSFDTVFDANCLHFFHGDHRKHFIREGHRILKPGATLIIDTIVNQPKEEHWEMLGYDPTTRSRSQNGVKMNYFTEVPELLELVTSNGFTVVSTEITQRDDDHIWLVATK